ncbi:MAG: hypothetical protein A3D96_06155 [Chlamydiae bacterium RIFCSPHIGHO2_12_FULL_44_59]|nr:MAG: hypothetical protein A2796_03980 [Chlamydiae bacterium RIFCSPHIGHO2_01_FULL_44_39]OGN57485.1 MAG: hypothetical protein A3C42_05915 [Chlamydiae bacterium RIFCSPHIGHO2_02_FULL_45_9]OGN61206.1 MAG: hypothetical protein A3D96_06155 [Chlamydiae bacterium RIFCSPHIGHO2_12_FULL_44_59]OGN65676.1 MAG: hypothetical protein A2978_06960 [Chlamydiae bacterium RIFCSPLOWO2_01_FULL_44_52]OGN68153.1 MAG: hypothetical protein A3I67_05630 [Chlamydiae bacterium RIFCSPLOWO2_02_FULL_45_22]OGN69041.1 MAG: hyp
MKTFWICLSLATTSFAEEKPQEPVKELEGAAIAIHSPNSSVIIIDPKARAKDIAQAFSALRKEKPTTKVILQTMDSSLYGVTDIKPTEGGTLLFIKVLSNQGATMHIVPVEQVMEIHYSP